MGNDIQRKRAWHIGRAAFSEKHGIQQALAQEFDRKEAVVHRDQRGRHKRGRQMPHDLGRKSSPGTAASASGKTGMQVSQLIPATVRIHHGRLMTLRCAVSSRAGSMSCPATSARCVGRNQMNGATHPATASG